MLIETWNGLVLRAATTALAFSFAACGLRDEACEARDTAAWLSVEPSYAVQSLDTTVKVSGRGASCGCCGGRPPARLIAYRLDADGDGVFELESAEPITTNLHFDVVGAHTLHAEVEDNNGTKAQESVEIEVLGSSSEALLRTVVSRIQLTGDAKSCTRRLCLWASTSLAELSLDRIRVEEVDGATTLLEVGPVRLTPTDTSLSCIDLPLRGTGDEVEIHHQLQGAETVESMTWYGNPACAQ